MPRQLTLDFIPPPASVSALQTATPTGYRGLYAFHKYWGKKPFEPLAYLIEALSAPGDVILDPFVGSGTAGREALNRGRRFIGIDINPVAIHLSQLLVVPPAAEVVAAAADEVRKTARPPILGSYLLEDGKTPATHYLWDDGRLSQVWVVDKAVGRSRREFAPTDHDVRVSQAYSDYQSRFVRNPQFFTNSRINAERTLSLSDLLTGRAQRNIDLRIDAINHCPMSAQPALRLCLTAASGQMTRMVFAVSRRGKTTGEMSSKIEVGSWVIGYWRPKQHFEVNVWHCFEHRVRKLLKAVRETATCLPPRLASRGEDVLSERADCALVRGDCRTKLRQMPPDSVQLVVTDPPHSDRVPYLELSEFWNSLLGEVSDFSREIVFSNAKERGKTRNVFQADLSTALGEVNRVLRPGGFLCLLFNARQPEQWAAIRELIGSLGMPEPGRLRFVGRFPCAYSTGSVVQDNRDGSLKTDYALVFGKRYASGELPHVPGELTNLPDWSALPPDVLDAEMD